MYDYFLENRILGANVPGYVNSNNPYLTNPRVNAFRVTDNNNYLGTMTTDAIKTMYEELSTMENWDEIKEKAYFYTADEPTSGEINDYHGSKRPTVETVNSEYKRIAGVWPDPYAVVPYIENHPYPSYSYSTSLALNSNGTYQQTDDGREAFKDIKDGIQGIFDANSVTIWCPKVTMYTPEYYLKSVGYAGDRVASKIEDTNGTSSGFNVRDVNGRYFNWNSKYGAFEDRINSYIADRAEAGQKIKLWWYACGKNSNYSYAYHLIENTGLQTEIMTWQAMQVGVTGYLYYGVNLWDEWQTIFGMSSNSTAGSGIAYDGSAEADMWPCNRSIKNNYPVYGNGVLIYPKSVISKLRLKKVDVLGTLRVEQLRDGIEDWVMLDLYRDIYGEAKMQNLISKVSKDVICYLSTPTFDTSGFSADMTSDDIFAEVRKELGNAVEAGSCEHVWDDGIITKDATCMAEGEALYTCTICGAEKTEVIAKGGHTTVRKVLTPSTSTTAGQWQNYCTVCEQNVGEVADLPVLEKFSASIADVTVKAGEEVTISVNADIPSTGLWGTVIHAVWDKALGADVAFANGDVLREFQAASASEITDGNLAKYAEYGITFDKTASDYYKSAISAFPTGEDQTNVTADGTLYTMTLTAPKAAGTYYVGFVVADEILGNIWEPDGNYYTYDSDTRIVWAKITVEKEAVEGDVDGDGKLSAKDISALNNILAGFRDETPTADVNGDGKITARDISALRNIIAGY